MEPSLVLRVNGTPDMEDCCEGDGADHGTVHRGAGVWHFLASLVLGVICEGDVVLAMPEESSV
jgi:hypothetical protein